jgi:phosphohistidine phosphatase
MKTLYIVRHAKSDWSIPGQSDFERGLNDRGKNNAPMMAGLLRRRAGKADLLVSSPAVRAITTAKYFAGEMGIPFKDILQKPEIYEATCPDLLGVVNELPGHATTVILFGHNPGLSLLVGYLTGEHIDLPTCAIAGITFELEDWSMVSADMGRLVYYDYPRKHMKE